MIRQEDLFSVVKEQALMSVGSQYGVIGFRYEVRQLFNVSNLQERPSYQVICSQRIRIANASPFNLTPSKISEFRDYPIAVSLKTQVAAQGDQAPVLLDYSPRTLNATVMTSANASSGSSQSFSRQHSTGSSVSQTNSYNASVSVGFFGDLPTGSASFDYGHSDTKSSSRSDSTGQDHGTNQARGTSDSMSIKDWGSYAYLDVTGSSVTWLWGQEYPWDVLQYRSCSQGNNADLPDFVTERLFNLNEKPQAVYPPSHLSLLGIDFTMKASWSIELAPDIAKQTVKLTHDVTYLSASHGLNEQNKTFATLSAAPLGFQFSSPDLDLTRLGLNPISTGLSDNGAVVGFNGNQFIVPPVSGAAFKIISGSNNLQVDGKGFDQGMVTKFDHGPVVLNLSFKITDDTYQYSVFMKHWKTTQVGCTLHIVFNGDEANAMVRHVDDIEGEGGSANLLTLGLRNKDYSSIDYLNVLKFGLNEVTITVTPDQAGAGYQLRALAIGEA